MKDEECEDGYEFNLSQSRMNCKAYILSFSHDRAHSEWIHFLGLGG